MSGIRKDFITPIVVLALICLVISAALAYTNSVTEPIIKQDALDRAEAARIEVMPEADAFELMDLTGLPETIKEIYRSTNDVGYVFMITTQGYGGDMDLICGIDADGKITACKTLAHSETAGLGSKTAEVDFRSQFIGKDSNLDGVSAISGATISSTAYIGAINDAFTAYETAKEADA